MAQVSAGVETGPGAWHCDTQSEAPDLTLERARIKDLQSAQFRIALEDDDNLEIVPGSAYRWDTDEELQSASADVWARTGQTTTPDMLGVNRISLKAGDAFTFHAWSIHRGHYDIAPVRRTLDVIYAWSGFAAFAIPGPSCFQNTEIIAALSPDACTFFETFRHTYEPYWGRCEE